MPCQKEKSLQEHGKEICRDEWLLIGVCVGVTKTGWEAKAMKGIIHTHGIVKEKYK